jgi:hypothetical protein
MNIFIVPYPDKGFNYFWCCPRGTEIVNRGLRLINEVKIVDNPDEADFIIHSYVPHFNGIKSSEIISRYDPAKLVIIDWTDEPDYILYDKYFAYFKRSWVFPKNMSFIVKEKYPIDRPKNMFPFWYSIMKEFQYQSNQKRIIDVGCYLRDTCANRKWVINACYNIFQKLNKEGYHCHIGPVSNETRSKKENTYFDSKYLSFLKKTKIVVTCNPTQWEGDSRLWEAIANGCLVFVDKLFVPYLKPLSNVIQYTVGNELELEERLRQYLYEPQFCKEKAEDNFNYCLQWHTEKARMEYIVKTLESLSCPNQH